MSVSCRNHPCRLAGQGPLHTFFAAAGLIGALSGGVGAQALPQGGTVVHGGGVIGQNGRTLTITQQTDKLVTEWQRFSIAKGHTVQFIQPSASSVALNRVTGADASVIQGALRANGQVFLLNPNGVLFSATSQVNVGGLFASTLSLGNEDFLTGQYRFSGQSDARVVNRGRITASEGGVVALVAARVENHGRIEAVRGSVALAAGRVVTLDMGGPVKVQVEEGALNALIAQGGAIRASGGMVYLTARAAGDLMSTVIRHTGVTEAQTLATGERGQIVLLGGMAHDRIEVGGRLDVSAPSGGDGGFVETSAARVKLAPDLRVTARASSGQTGTWLIDPQDYLIAATGGDITGAQLTSVLNDANVEIQSGGGATAGSGDILVRDAVTWSANTLTLTAARDVRIEAVMTATGTASLALNPATANGADPANASGTVRVGTAPGGGFSGRVDFGGRAGTGLLSIGGVDYTVINALGSEGSTSGTDLQGMSGNLAGRYALGGHIDAAATSGWASGFNPVGNGSGSGEFTGQFDGLGNVVSNLNINRPGQYGVGLFGVTDHATLRNVGLTNVHIVGGERTGALVGAAVFGGIHNNHASGTVSGAYYVGGLIGTAHELTTRESRSSVTVSADREVGGLVGFNGGWIEHSYATGNVTATGAMSGSANGAGGLVGANTGVLDTSYATGAVTGHSFVGGLTGYSNNYIVNTYATGSVTATGDRVGGLVGHHGGNIVRSYATGAVSSPGNEVGGLTGHSDSAWAANTSFWDVQRSGQAASGAGHGMNTADFRAAANFTSATLANGYSAPGWDFNHVWVMYEGHTDPLLRAHMTPLRVTAGSVNKTYDGQAYTGSHTASYSLTPDMGLIAGTLAYGGSADGATQAGSYAITPSGLRSNQQGYLISYTSGTLTIDPRAITLAVDNQRKFVNAADPVFTHRLTAGSLVEGDSLSVTTTRAPGEAAGSYAIAANVPEGGNYDVTTLDGTLLIERGTPPEAQEAAVRTTLPASLPRVAFTAPITLAPPTPGAAASNGLVFVSAPAAPDAGAGAAPTGASGGASGGRDGAGFMRVFVVSGGIRMPANLGAAATQEGQ